MRNCRLGTWEQLTGPGPVSEINDMEYITYSVQGRHLLQEANGYTFESQSTFLKVSMSGLYAFNYRRWELPSFCSLFTSILQTMRTAV